jgi:hypothetical protein
LLASADGRASAGKLKDDWPRVHWRAADGRGAGLSSAGLLRRWLAPAVARVAKEPPRRDCKVAGVLHLSPSCAAVFWECGRDGDAGPVIALYDGERPAGVSDVPEQFLDDVLLVVGVERDAPSVFLIAASGNASVALYGFSGATLRPLLEEPLYWIEYPIFTDVDGDGVVELFGVRTCGLIQALKLSGRTYKELEGDALGHARAAFGRLPEGKLVREIADRLIEVDCPRIMEDGGQFGDELAMPYERAREAARAGMPAHYSPPP